MNLLTVYDRMRNLGMVGNKREFSRLWLGKGRTYLRDYIEDDRLHATVPHHIVTGLRERLTAVAARTPAGAAREIMSVVETIDHATMVQDFMRRA
jgi:hypothetical protein